MADASVKKRKRNGEAGAKPRKKVAIDGPASAAKVSSILRPKSSPPVIAMTPGIQIPNNLSFNSYAPQSSAQSKQKLKKHAGGSELLLHSSTHRSLDYTAREEGSRNSAPLLNHYVGVYDPQTGKMQVVEAKKMVVRPQVRAKPAEAADEEAPKKSNFDRKTDLGQAFGTKKAKKALNDMVINAIAPTSRDAPKTKVDDAAKAMLSSVGAITSTMASREALQSVVDDAKPVPKANLNAEEIQDVYDPRVIIGEDILNLVPIREWQEKAEHNDSIEVQSRYVADRVAAIASNPDAVQRLRVLRYAYFVMLFYKSTVLKGRGLRKIPQSDKLRTILEPAPEAVIDSIRRKFSEDGMMRKFHQELLMTYMCAMTCIIDNFEVDTSHLVKDLSIEQKALNKFYQEIGGRVVPRSIPGTKVKRQVAVLTLPLKFPKQSVGARKR
ncbi:a49-like RNA polymerase I associated factor domain-containing protein [Sarocladium implicatum]|nr:a49-like RNA polymerase I associated factor domain-containing protein [Sarocladium implicatum]